MCRLRISICREVPVARAPRSTTKRYRRFHCQLRSFLRSRNLGHRPEHVRRKLPVTVDVESTPISKHAGIDRRPRRCWIPKVVDDLRKRTPDWRTITKSVHAFRSRSHSGPVEVDYLAVCPGGVYEAQNHQPGEGGVPLGRANLLQGQYVEIRLMRDHFSERRFW